LNVQLVLGFLPCTSAGLATGFEPEINPWPTKSPLVSSYTANQPGIAWVWWWMAPCRRFNNWFLSLGVRVTVLDPKFSRLQLGTTDSVIYRDKRGDVISDETLADIAGLSFSKEEIAKREAAIRREMAG